MPPFKTCFKLYHFLLLILFGSFAFTATAQDSAVYRWEVTANRLSEQSYELVFKSTGGQGWQLYAPNEVISDVPSTTIELDSSITVRKPFKEMAAPKSVRIPVFDNSSYRIYEGPAKFSSTIEFTGTVPANLQGKLTYTFGRGDEFYPGNVFEFSVPLEGGKESETRILIPSIDLQNPVSNCGDEDAGGKSLFRIFLLGLLGGFIALLTPCVFPVIPLTVSFFTKKTSNRNKGVFNALLYGFFIFLIYILLSVPFHLVSNVNPEVLNNISTNVWLNLLFFLIFVFFAISFFGYFEITLPGGLANKIDSRSGMGTLGGIFFMALTLAIVSFSCTGPILGTLLAGTAAEGAWPLTAGLAGFGLALALPFALFAMFPGWLNSLPKSGGWLTSVKVVLGFLELAMAIKFLSNADLVEQWGIIKREIFIGAWVLIGVMTIMYLLGWIRFPHDAKLQRISPVRWFFIAAFAAATIYLVPGLTNTEAANLRLISGFPPPLCYSLYKEPVNCETGIEPLRDYEEALALARKQNKPLLVDFTGWACVNCRRMEENIWVDQDVMKMMKNDFVVVSLYVDERKMLPPSEQLLYKTKSGAAKQIRTVGDKWATFQSENFGAVSQPQYAILSPDERVLTKTKGYTPEAGEFKEWLVCGLEGMKVEGRR